MARVTSQYGLTQLRCDHRGCVERFNSYSDKSIVRDQANLAGWIHLKGDRDLCPEHKPKPRMSGEPDTNTAWGRAVDKARAGAVRP